MPAEQDLKVAMEIAAAAAQSAATAQGAAERAAEECRTIAVKIRAYEARRPVVKEITREIGIAGAAADLSPLTARIEALETGRPPIDPARLAQLERLILETRDQLASMPRSTTSEVVPGLVSDLLDRMAALEQLVIESVRAPEALAAQLRLTADVMQAMDDRFHAIREADLATLDLHREASVQTAIAQGGLAAVVESMRVDMEGLTHAVAHLKNQLNRRDSFTAQIVKRGAA